MKNYIAIIGLVTLLFSCAEKSTENKDSEIDFDLYSNKETNQETAASNNDATEESKNQLNDLFKMGQGLLGKSDTQGTQGMQLDTDMILDLLGESGVSRADMEKLINNPDSLRILAQEAMKIRKNSQEKEVYKNKGKLSKEHLASKNTPTGVSLEEAILLVQAESGPEATMAKLKKIDSLAGTNVMEQLDLTEAGYVMRDVERKNEPKASAEEEKKIAALNKLSGQMHSETEAKELMA